jgi:2-iminobutanoate/2-iminopropanoate deaminase
MGARVGPLLCSSGIPGVDPATGQLPASAADQARHAFANLKAVLAAGGATLADVAKPINAEWLACFPDPHDRPARHTLVYDLQHGMWLQLEVIAYVKADQRDATH